MPYRAHGPMQLPLRGASRLSPSYRSQLYPPLIGGGTTRIYPLLARPRVSEQVCSFSNPEPGSPGLSLVSGLRYLPPEERFAYSHTTLYRFWLPSRYIPNPFSVSEVLGGSHPPIASRRILASALRLRPLRLRAPRRKLPLATAIGR